MIFSEVFLVLVDSVGCFIVPFLVFLVPCFLSFCFFAKVTSHRLCSKKARRETTKTYPPSEAAEELQLNYVKKSFFVHFSWIFSIFNMDQLFWIPFFSKCHRKLSLASHQQETQQSHRTHRTSLGERMMRSFRFFFFFFRIAGVLVLAVVTDDFS